MEGAGKGALSANYHVSIPGVIQLNDRTHRLSHQHLLEATLSVPGLGPRIPPFTSPSNAKLPAGHQTPRIEQRVRSFKSFNQFFRRRGHGQTKSGQINDRGGDSGKQTSLRPS